MPALSGTNPYLWKCWRDTRSTFYFLASALGAITALGLFVYFDPFDWIAAKAEESRFLWISGAQTLMLTMVGVTPLAGFLFGSLGVGTEFERRTADFLLTRPYSRPFLLWTSWAVSAAQVLGLVVFGITMNWIAPFRGSPSRSAGTLIGVCVVALTIYSVTFLMTTLSRNSRHGLGLGVFAFMAYTGLYVWLKLWYEIKIPYVFDLTFSSGRRGAGIENASLLATFANPVVFGWLAVCGAMTFAAQKIFERAEV